MTKSKCQIKFKIQIPRSTIWENAPQYTVSALWCSQNNSITMSLIECSLSRSCGRGTSIGANYAEADGAESKMDFRHKIALCKKEAKETMHWLRLLAKANPEHADACRDLWKETHELTLIFSAILRAKERANVHVV